jgi:putative membrane protein
LIFLPAMILRVSGHYTYVEVPPRLLDGRVSGFTRNDYNRIGHFVQGFVPAILTREILRRRTMVTGRGWLFFLDTCVCSPSARSSAGRMVDGGADRVRGHDTPGDPWDTHRVGVLSSQLVLGRVHDRQLI